MESKHTLGPWRPGGRSGSLRPDSRKTFQGKPYQETTRVCSTNEEGYLKNVACVFQGEGGVGSPQALAEQDANMALICAAPEMLEALSDLVENFDGVIGVHDLEHGSRLRDAARSAIAKATGGVA